MMLAQPERKIGLADLGRESEKMMLHFAILSYGDRIQLDDYAFQRIRDALVTGKTLPGLTALNGSVEVRFDAIIGIENRAPLIPGAV